MDSSEPTPPTTVVVVPVSSEAPPVKRKKIAEPNPDIYIPLKDPAYHNHIIEGPDGTVLCRCGPKKINWYMSRGLASIVCEDPLTIRLNFKPGGNGDSDCAYQLGHKENICVVCGRDDHNTKHHIVEYEYRKHFPEEYKSHNSYDVVILCGPCHGKYELVAAEIKNELAAKYDAPVNGRGWYHDNVISKLKKAAGALLKARDKMPPNRIQELEAVIKNHTKQEIVTDEELQSLFNGLDPLVRTSDYKTHGELVVVAVGDSEEQRQKFVEMWRQHFLDTMNPKFLHPSWRVDKRVFKEIKSSKRAEQQPRPPRD